MIPRSAIKRYLGEPREDCRWLKELSHKALDKKLANFIPKPRFWPKLGLHQKAGLFAGIYFGSFGFWFDMGTGKTLLSLELLQYWWDTGQLRRALIFVTSDKAFPTWERQIRQYKITIPFCSLDASSSKEKWKILDRFDEGIILLHYPGAVAMTTKLKKKRKKWGKAKTLDLAKVNRLINHVDAVVFDESTKAANTGSLTYRLCRRVSKQAEFRYALAGMPFGRDPTPLWSQMYLVDHGETLGPTLELFREAFFNKTKNYWGGPYSFKYTFRKKMKPLLSRFIQHNSLTYTAGECIDLPQDVPPILVPLRLPPETKAYYQEVVEELITARGNKSIINNAFHRLRQLSSGFLGLRDDDTGERAEIEFPNNPKLEWLIDKLDNFQEDRKALIFYQYTYSGRRIVQEIKKELGIDAVWLWSGTKNPREAIRSFIEDDDKPYCVINNQVGAYSLDGLQRANYELLYEPPVSVIDMEQAKRRIFRQGQQRKCFFYFPVVEGTIDEKLLEFHQEGRDLFKALLTNPSKVLA